MISIATVIGMVIGAVFFSMRNSFILGGLIGGAIAFLLTKIMVMEDRLATLEKRLKSQAPKKNASATVPPQPIKKPSPPPTTVKPAESPELDFEIFADTAPPQQFTPKLTPRPAASQEQSPTLPVNPTKEKSHTIEWWDI
ncbi:MAG: hypothetical protein KAS94_05655, partial [Desulfobulbaceae bacterium]|nr:hypothetical protein [Desulfobulbaceae bacterium]